MDFSQRLCMWAPRGRRGGAWYAHCADRYVIWTEILYGFPWPIKAKSGAHFEGVTTITFPWHYWPRGAFGGSVFR